MICYIEVPLKAGLTVVITLDAGADPGFQARGAHLKKLRRSEVGAKIVGVFRVKNHDFTPKNHIFFQFRGSAPPPPPPLDLPLRCSLYVEYGNLRVDLIYLKTHLNISKYVFGQCKLYAIAQLCNTLQYILPN